MTRRTGVQGVWRTVGLTAALTSACALPVTAKAQNALGDGRALDQNLQVGSGGVNAPQALPYTIDGGNAIITGNVTGTSAFRGRVDYVAPGEFQGRAGSDDLFRFRAQSYSPDLSGGVTSGPTGRSVFAPVEVLRSSSAAAVADVLSRDPGATLERVDGMRVRPSREPVTTYSPTPPQQGLGLVRQADGSLLAITASPLLGVKREVVAPPPEASASPALPPPPGAVDPAAAQTPSTALPPALLLGLPLQSMQDPALRTPLSDAGARGLAQWDLTLLSPLERASAEAVQADPYLAVLAEVRERRAGRGAAALPQTDQQEPALAPPTPQELATAEAARIRAMQAARGLASTQPPPTAGADPAVRDQGQERVQRWVEALDYDLPALASLAATRSDRVNHLLRQGEQAIVEGRFLDAENRYRQVLVASPGHPLARVGLVHAQLGAGLIRSAALNLRALLTEHPELISARYDAALLPSPPRLRWVRGQLEQMLRLTTRPEPALLMAYLGYQQRVESLTAYGLDLAQARQGHDPLIPLLRRLWLNAPTGTGPDQGKP